MVSCLTLDAILDDNILEEQETFLVSIFEREYTPRAYYILDQRVITIVDDESKIHLITYLVHIIYVTILCLSTTLHSLSFQLVMSASPSLHTLWRREMR